MALSLETATELVSAALAMDVHGDGGATTRRAGVRLEFSNDLVHE
jgi:hypothetical protein